MNGLPPRIGSGSNQPKVNIVHHFCIQLVVSQLLYGKILAKLGGGVYWMPGQQKSYIQQQMIEICCDFQNRSNFSRCRKSFPCPGSHRVRQWDQFVRLFGVDNLLLTFHPLLGSFWNRKHMHLTVYKGTSCMLCFQWPISGESCLSVSIFQQQWKTNQPKILCKGELKTLQNLSKNCCCSISTRQKDPDNSKNCILSRAQHSERVAYLSHDAIVVIIMVIIIDTEEEAPVGPQCSIFMPLA